MTYKLQKASLEKRTGWINFLDENLLRTILKLPDQSMIAFT